MPLFSFHIMDGERLVESHDSELPGVAEARAEAIRMVAAILSEKGAGTNAWHLNVVDAEGQAVVSLRFSPGNDEQTTAPGQASGPAPTVSQ